MFSRPRGIRTICWFLYISLVFVTTFFAAVSCAFLLSQAVRTAPHHTWEKNFNAVVIGAAYAIVCVVSLAVCLNRRIAVHRRLQRISKTYRILGRADLPDSVHRYIQQEYTRACLITYESQPRDGSREGWGKPGTSYAGVRFRPALLDTIRTIDGLAHLIIPHHPVLRPHVRMLHHFRFILPLLPKDVDGLTPLHTYDAAIQLVRCASREPTEAEFEAGMTAYVEIKRMLEECRMEMLEGSSSDLGSTISAEF